MQLINNDHLFFKAIINGFSGILLDLLICLFLEALMKFLRVLASIEMVIALGWLSVKRFLG